MTQKEIILEAFQRYGYKLTLGQVLQHPWGYKFASRCADLRKEGYQITCHKAEKASDNLYVLQHWDNEGQGSLL